jgi:cytochrome c peroxidase
MTSAPALATEYLNSEEKAANAGVPFKTEAPDLDNAIALCFMPTLSTIKESHLKMNVNEVHSQCEQSTSPRKLAAMLQNQRRQLTTILSVGCCTLLAAVMMFGTTLAANMQAKDLFLAPSQVPKIVDADGKLVSVAQAKVSVPLGLAPFLSQDQLRDIEVIGYFDCAEQEEVWGRVISVRRYAPAEPDAEDAKVTAEVKEFPSNYSMSFELATGQFLVVDSEGEYIDFPEENRTQELCGELQCAQLHLEDFDLAKLEDHAAALLEGSHSDARRLQRGRGGRGRRGRQCRRCQTRTPPPRRGRRGPRSPVPTPAPTAAPTPSPPATTPSQIAAVAVANGVGNMLATAGSRANRADLLGAIVRLAFHDAGTFDGASGGADGCVDLNAVENRGLRPITEQLETLVAGASPALSRADVWALAASVAIEAAGGPSLSFRFGRVDSQECSGHASRLPSAESDHEHIRSVFVTRLGFTERDVVALMGAHVLGRAVSANSGYEGSWVPGNQNDRFTNRFLRDLLVVPWNKVTRQDFEGMGRTQWNGRGNTMMLNTDIELAFDTSTCNRAGGRPGGGGNRCSRASHGFSDAVTEFSTDQASFFQAFAPAFERMTALGSSSLLCAFDDCSTPPGTR